MRSKSLRRHAIMKRNLLLFGLLGSVTLCVADVYAQQTLQSGAVVTESAITRQRDSVTVSMTIDISEIQVKSQNSILLHSRYIQSDGVGSAYLPPVEVMGRTRHIYFQRNPDAVYSDEVYCSVVKKSKETQVVHYKVTLPYVEWMDHSRLQIVEDLCGCGKVSPGALSNLTEADVSFEPYLAYVVPEAEVVKSRDLSGCAYLDFRLNRTNIDPGYRENPVELKRIISSIDTVKNDKDFTITSIELCGYASPEGSYQLNERLAKGRTNALRNYLIDKYGFTDSFIKSSYEPENWKGLVEYLRSSNLSDKEAILAYIENGPSDVDVKERQMQIKFPDSYEELLKNCYPGLRRTNYRINYVIKSFNLEEAKKLVRTAPQRLSLQEMFAVAQTYEPGSDDFNYVFDVAVRMYPHDDTANINAANALLEQGRAKEALVYLDKVKSDSPQVENARGVACILLKDYENARLHIGKALEGKLPEAQHNMNFLK